MTIPSTQNERKQIVIDSATFRGRSCGADPTIIPNEKQTQRDTSTMEDFIPSQSSRPSAEEDMYLPMQMNPLVKTLPHLLWKKSFRNEEMIDMELKANRTKMEMLAGLRGLVADLFPLFDRSSNAPGDLFFPESLAMLLDEYGCSVTNSSSSSLRVLVLDYLPILRSIGLLERVAENTTKSVMDDLFECRKVRTRSRSQQQKRHHYYDKFSAVLRTDEGTMSSTEIGIGLADSLLIYK